MGIPKGVTASCPRDIVFYRLTFHKINDRSVHGITGVTSGLFLSGISR